MRNLYYILYTAILLQSCGFQSRKYTNGYFGRNAHTYETQTHSLTYKPQTYSENPEVDNLKLLIESNLSTEIPSNRKGLEIQKQTSPAPTARSEIKEIKKHETNDTLKLKLQREKRDSTYVNPKEIDHWVKIRRKNTLCKGITLCLTLFASLLLPLSIDDNALFIALAIVSVILIIFSLRIVIADIKLHRLMKSRPTEDKIKNWYKQQHRRNVLAALLLPLNGIMLYMCAILAVLGIAILFGWV